MIDINFLAIDFETATGYGDSICEVGVCVVIHGMVVETRSWLVRPPHNIYWRRNIEIHGITPRDTKDAPDFAEVWEEIERLYLDDISLVVAHNAPFDRGCLHKAAKSFNIHLPPLDWDCSLSTARRIYRFSCNSLGHLCRQLAIPEGKHHRAGDDAEMCARLYLRELEDME